MHRLKLFVAVTLLQVSSFWIHVSTNYQAARAAESAEAGDKQQGASHDGGDEQETTENTQTSPGARATSSGEHEKSQGAPETSHVSEAHLNVPYQVPDFQPLQYPHPASAERLNKDAMYQVGGKRYKFLEQKGKEYIFVRVADNVRIPFYAVGQFEVLSDPVAQLEKDLEVIPEIQQRVSQLYIQLTPHVTLLDNSVQALQAAAAPAHREASEEAVHGAIEAMEQQFSRMEQELDTVAGYQTEIADLLRKGLNLCEDMQRRADLLTSRLDVGKKIRQVCSSLNDEMNTVGLERYDYTETLKKSLEKISVIRRAAKLALDLQEVRERVKNILGKAATIERELKTVVEEIEAITTKVASTEEATERNLRAATLKSTLMTVQKQVEDLTGGAGALKEQLHLLKSFKERCEQYAERDVLVLDEEIVEFRKLAAEAELSERVLGDLFNRAAAGIAALKEYTVSYEILDSNWFNEGVQKVRARAASLNSSDLEVKAAGQALSNGLQNLMEAVHQISLADLESKLEDVQRLEEAYASALAAAKESLDSQVEAARDLTSEVRRLAAFVNTPEEEKELIDAEALVSERVARYEAHRQLVHSTTLRERFEAAVQQALTLPLDVARKRLSEAEAKQTNIKALLASRSREADTTARLVEACHEVSEDIKGAAEVSEIFRKCYESANVRGTLARVFSGDWKPLADTLAERWSGLLSDTRHIEASLDKLTAAIEVDQQGRQQERLVAMIIPLLESVLPHVEELKRGDAEEEGAGAASGDTNEVLGSLEALQDLLKSPNTPDFGSRLQSSLVNVLKAALTSAAGHLQSARAAEQKAARILAGEEPAGRPQDLADTLQDLPPEAVAATKALQEHLSLAQNALAIYDGLKSLPNVSSSLESVPFSASGIAEESLSAAAQVCEGETSKLIERQKAIYDVIETHQARVKSHLQTHLKELLRLADAALKQLRSKEELVTSEQQRSRIQAQEDLYSKARDAVFACMSGSAMRIKEARACFLSFLKVIVSSATHAAEQAEKWQREAEDLYKSSSTGFENEEDINRACSLAVEEVELSREALDLYFGSNVAAFVEGTADASSGTGGTGVSFKEKAEQVREQVASVLERVRQLREQIQSRPTAAAGMLRASISQALAVVQRGLEEVRSLAGVQAGDQKVFVDIVQELESMLASVPATSDLPEHRRRFEDRTRNMKTKLLGVAERHLAVVKVEKAKAEVCVHDTTARPSPSSRGDTFQIVCQELQQELRFVKVALNVFTEIGEVHGVPASSDSERGQQLTTETVSLEEQLHTLCDEAARQQEAKTHEAEEKLKMMMMILEETLVPAARTLSEAGDPMQTATRLRHHLASFGVFQLKAFPPSLLPAAVKQQQVNTLRFLTEIILSLQEECKGHIAMAETLLAAPEPRLVLPVVSRNLEDPVRDTIFRSQDISDVTKSLLKVYASIYGEHILTTEEPPVGAGCSPEEAIRLPEKATYFECTAEAERIDAALQMVPKRLSEKIRALREAAWQVIDKVAHGAEEAMTKIDAEHATGMNPAPSCTDGEARAKQIKSLFEKSLEMLKNPAIQWGTKQYAMAVGPAIGNVLTAVLEEAEMHVEVARSKTPAVETCVTEGISCDDLGLNIDADELDIETEPNSNIQKHAEAASHWLELYESLVSDEDTRDIAASHTGGPSSVPLPERQVKLSTEVSGLEEVAQQLSDQINLRATSLTHLVEARLRPVLNALEKGIDMADELLEDISNDEVVERGGKLKERFIHALAELQELEKTLHRAASSSQNEAQVAGVLSMLVTHASDLVEEGKSHEQSILDCLNKPLECPILLPATQALDALAACTRVSSITLDVFADCVKPRFSEHVARRTLAASGVTLLQRADQLVKAIELLDARIPVLAVEIRNQRGRGTYQDYLAQIVSLIASGFENLNDVDPLQGSTSQQRRKECEQLSDALVGLQGAVIPPLVHLNVRTLFKKALVEATRQVGLAEERLQAAEGLVDDSKMNVVTVQSLATMKSSAEQSISEGLKRATAARLLLAAVDRGVDETGKMRDTLESVAEAGDMGTAESVLKKAEACRSQANELREKLAYSEAMAGELAAQSLSGLIMVTKDVIEQLENDPVTRKSPEVVRPFTVRLNALLGLVQVLRETWNFPASLEEYIFYTEALAREFVKTASTNVSAAVVLRDLAMEHAARLRPPVHRETSKAQEVVEAFFEQGLNLVHVASVSIDGLWIVLTAGEVSRPKDGSTVTVALDKDVKDKFIQQAISLSEQIAQVKEQLNVGGLRGIMQAQQALLVELATDRINGIVGSLHASVDLLAQRLEKLPARDQIRRQLVSEELQIYRETIETLTEYRDGHNFPGSAEQLYTQFIHVLSICIRNAQGNLDKGKGAVMQAHVYLSSVDLSSAPSRKERTLLQARNAIRHASERRVMAAMDLDTFDNCARALLIARLAETVSDTPGGPSLQDKANSLRQRARELSSEIEEMKQEMANSERDQTTGEEGGRAPTLEAPGSLLPTLMGLSEYAPASTPSPVGQEFEEATVAELRLRLSSAAGSLRSAEEKRRDIQKCIADAGQCEEMISPDKDIVEVSNFVRASLMAPVLAADGELKQFLADISSTETAREMTGAQVLHDGAAATGVHEQAGGTPTSISALHAFVRPLVELLDPSSEMLHEAEGLAEATKAAEVAAVRATAAIKAVLVLRRLSHILERLMQRVEEEQAASDYGSAEDTFFLKEECRLMHDNLAELQRDLVVSADIDDCMPVIDHIMHRLLENGNALVNTAKQAVEMAEEIFTEATPGPASVTERISKIEKHVEASSYRGSVTRHVVDSLYEVVQAVSLLQFSGGVTVAETGTLATIAPEIDQLSELAESVQRKLEEIKKRAQDLQQYLPSRAKASVKALMDVLKTTDQQLFKSIQGVQGHLAKILPQQGRINLQALGRSLQAYRQTPPPAGASTRFADTVAAVGWALVHFADIALDNAERRGAQISARLDEGSDGAPDADVVLEGCSQMSEQIALSNIALRALEACQDTRALRNILSKREAEQQTSVAEKGGELKERATALASQLQKLREAASHSIYGSASEPSTQKLLLSQIITDTVEALKQAQWVAETPHSGVDSTNKDLLGIVAELKNMGEAPQEVEVHGAAAKAVEIATSFASSLAQEAEQRQGRVRRCLSDTEQCESTGDGGDEAPSIKRELRAIDDLMGMATTALYLASLPERESYFGSTSGDTSLSAGVLSITSWGTGLSADVLSVKLEQLRALSGILGYQALQREVESQVERQQAIRRLCRALYMSINDVSPEQVPKGVEEAKTRFVWLLTSIMESLQELLDGCSVEELRNAAGRLLVSILEMAGDNIEDAEVKVAKARERLEPHKDEDGLIAQAMVHVKLAEAALRALHLGMLHPLLQQALTETLVEVPGEGGGEEQIVAQKQGDQLLQRARRLRESIRELLGPSVASDTQLADASTTQVVEAMVAVLSKTIRRLSDPEFKISGPLLAKVAELQMRLQILRAAARSGTTKEVQNAVTHEVREAVADMSESLGDSGLADAAAVVDQMRQLLNYIANSVDTVAHTADDLRAKGGDAVDATSFLKLVNDAEHARTGAFMDFNNAGEDLEKTQRRITVDTNYATVLHDMAEDYLGINGIDAILDNSAQAGQHSFTDELGDEVHNSAAALLQEKQERAENIIEEIRDLRDERAREQERMLRALGQVVPQYVDGLKGATAKLVAEGALLLGHLNAVTRVARNVGRKLQGKTLLPPSGVGADVSLPNEHQLSASELLREATGKHVAFKAMLQDLSSRVNDLLLHIDEVLSFVQKHMTRRAQARRLSADTTLDSAGPMLLQMKELLYQLQERLRQMSKEAEAAIKAALQLMSKLDRKTEAKNTRGPQYLGVALGIGLPILLFAIGGCAYYHYRRRKRKCTPNLTSASGSELQSSARSRGLSGELQVSRYDFGEADGSVASVDPSEPRGIRTLTSLETPDAGVPDTTQRQYMVDEHYVVATQMKEDALKKEQQFEHTTFL